VAIGTSVRADYTYDGKSRLASRVTQNQAGAGKVSFSRLCCAKPVPTFAAKPVERLFHDNDNRVIAEVNATGTTVREYIWMDDLPVAVLDGTTSTTNPTLFWVHADHLNRPVAMSNAAKAWVWRAQYEPFGAVHQIVGPAANDSRFPGQWFQLEAGLAYNWHRHYDATLGRYTQPDPLGLKTLLSDGPSVYGYAWQKPLEVTDPTGQFGIVGAGIGAGLSLSLQAASNWWRGCDVLNSQNYDWWDVGVSAVAGALGPSALGAGRDAFNSARRMSDLSNKLSKLKPGSGYHDRLGKKHQNELSKTADSLTFVGATQVLSAIAKSGNGNGGKSCSCR
jgi:RHS repeat-associated protein